MKKIVCIFLLIATTQVVAQTSTAPSPIEPILPTQTSPSNQPVASSQARGDTNSGYNRVDPIAFNTKLGVGSSFGPQALWITGDIEVQLDKFIAIGPKVQFGTKTGTDFFYTSIGPRLMIPLSYFEFGFGTGVGLAYRNVAGFEFSNFLYQAGVNLDFYFIQNLSLGVGYNINLLSSVAETVMTSATLTVAGHF